MIRTAFVPLIALLLACSLQAQEVPQFRLTTAGGPESVGSLRSLTGDGTLELESKLAVALKADAWLTLRRVAQSSPDLPRGLRIALTNGDLVPIGAPRLDGDRFRFVHPDLDGGKETGCSPGVVSLLWFAAPSQADAEVLQRRLLRERRKEDLTLLRNGDRLSGIPNQLTATNLVLQIDGSNRALDLKQVACVALNTDLAESILPAERYYRVTFRPADDGDATRLSLASLGCDGTTLHGKTLLGPALRIPLERLVAIEVVNGPMSYLTELKPSATRSQPALDWRWPIGEDATVAGRDLRLADGAYPRGLALAAGTSVTYRLDGKFRRFESRVGLDPVIGREGGVKIEVRCDGKPMSLEANELVGSATIRPVVLDVTGVKELTLSVLPGRRGAVQGHVNWAEARLIR